VALTQRLKADLSLALTTFLWGVTFVVVKDAVSRASVFLFLTLRFGLAALILALLQRKALRKLRREELLAGVWLGLFMFGGYVFQTFGLVFTTPTKSSFVTGFSVVLVPLLLALFWRGRLRLWEYAGALAAIGGLYFLTVPGGPVSRLNLGDLLTLVGATLYAFHIILVGRYARTHPHASLCFLQVAATALLSTGACLFSAATGWQRPRFDASWQLYAGIGVTAVFATAVAFTIQLWAQRYTSPSHAAVLFTLEPVFAAGTSYLLLGERLGGRALLGAGLVMAGILIAELKGPAPAAAESAEPAAGPA